MPNPFPSGALIGLTLATCMAVAAPAPEEPGESGVIYLATRVLEIPMATANAGAAPIRRHELWMTEDGGNTWQHATHAESRGGLVKVEVSSDGRFGFQVLAVDEVGHREAPPQPGDAPEVECVVDTTPPRLAVRRPDGTRRIYAGSGLALAWDATDANFGPTPVTVWYRAGGDDLWRPVELAPAYPAQHAMPWHPPYASGAFEVRLVARDLAGNENEWSSANPIEVVPFDGFRGSRVLLADEFSMFRRFAIHYIIDGIEALFVRQVEIWVRRGYGQWTRVVDDDRVSPYLFEAPDDGTYYFYLRASDLNQLSNREIPDEDTLPDLRVVVDTHPPLARLEVNDAGSDGFHRAGEPLELQWQVDDVNLATSRTRLDVSLDGGETWQPFVESLETTSGQGSFRWRPPFIETDHLTFRLIVEDLAANRTVVPSGVELRLVNPALDPVEASRTRHQRAIALAQRGDRASLELALESLDIALQYDPELATAWHDRGVVRTRLGRHVDAVADYTEALRLRPGDLHYTFSLIRGQLNVHRLGLDPSGAALDAARQGFSTVSRLAIYEHPDFQQLLATHKILESTLAEL